MQNKDRRLSQHTRGDGGTLALLAVVFDYGMVLTSDPDREAYEALQRISGLSAERLDKFYWADRHAYDEGKLTGLEFWHKIVRDAGLSLSDETVCNHAFRSALAKLVEAAHEAHAGAVVGIVSAYKGGHVIDDGKTFECHAGAAWSHVFLRAQLVKSSSAAGGAGQ